MSVSKHIFIAEDEANISDFLKRGLEDCGYEVSVASNGNEAWLMMEDGMLEERFCMLLLDIRMSGMNGLELCKRFRSHFGYKVPVLMLTALDTTEDIVAGLHAGADDYLAKPFKFIELLARIESLLRRSAVVAENSQKIHCGDLVCAPSTHRATRKNLTVDLSTKEYRLLEYFIRHQGEILSRKQLLRDVWDKDFDTNTNVVDVYVRYLRNKIDEPFPHKLIHTIVGVGYIMKE